MAPPKKSQNLEIKGGKITTAPTKKKKRRRRTAPPKKSQNLEIWKTAD